jgi:peptidoglycan/LPS O-acetylase OafA/YrhL
MVVKFRYLDGLRGVAALVVVFDHLAFMYIPYAINAGGEPHGLGPVIHNTPLQLLVAGDLAVSIFFILSGIVLSAKFFRTGQEGVVMASAIKRYFRLAIPVLGSAVLAYGLLRLGLMFNVPAGNLTSDWWKAFWLFEPNFWAAVTEGVWGAFTTTADARSYNPVLWTMQLEFAGSFLVFGMLLLFGKLRNRWAIYVVLGLLLWRTYYLAFLLGVMMCDYWFARGPGAAEAGHGEAGRMLRRMVWLPLLAVSLLLGSYPVAGTKGTIFDNIVAPYIGPNLTVLIHVVAAAGIILAVMSSGLMQRVLMWRPVLFLGRISFPLYLLHFMILGSYTSYLFVTLSAKMSMKTAMLITLVPTFAVLISAAYLFARYVDEPAIRLSGRVFARWFGPRRDAAVVQAAGDAEPGAAGSAAMAPTGSQAIAGYDKMLVEEGTP